MRSELPALQHWDHHLTEGFAVRDSRKTISVSVSYADFVEVGGGFAYPGQGQRAE
jgi:hypothetical protein